MTKVDGKFNWEIKFECVLGSNLKEKRTVTQN